MKKLLLITGIMAVVSFNEGYAQNNNGKYPPEQIAAQLTDFMTTELHLSDAQKAKVFEINRKELQDALKSNADSKMSDKQKDERMKTVLTVAQFDQYIKLKPTFAEYLDKGQKKQH